MKKLNQYIIFLITLLTLSGCGVHFGEYTLNDFDEKVITADIVITDTVKYNFFKHYNIYNDFIEEKWGLDNNNCKQFEETRCESKSGETSLSLTWDQSKCAWIGWGTAWNFNNKMDFSKIIENSALQLYVKNQKGESKFPTIKVAFEDVNEKNSYVEIGYRYFEADKIDTNWRKVLIPLKQFELKKKGVNTKEIRQLIMSFDGKGSIFMDQIEIVEFSGKSKNPFNKSKNEIYPILKAKKLELPMALYENDFAVPHWGFDKTKNKNISFSSVEKHSGSQSISWTWNYANAPDWVGWGFSINENEVLDISELWQETALEFYIKHKNPTNKSNSEIKVGFEDIYAKSSYVGLDDRYIKDTIFSSEWQRVVIPLKDYLFDSKGILTQNIKQIIFFSNWYEKTSHEVFIDDIKLIKYQGKSSNPFNKERYDVFIADENIISEEDSSTEGCFIGGFISNSPSGTGKEFSLLTGRKPACVMWYSDWGHEIDFDVIQKIIDDGYTPHMIWEAMLSMQTRDGVTLDDILEGKFDKYIKQTARNIKQLSGKMQIRIFHEFNGGGWYPWGPKINGREEGAEKLKMAWIRIHDIFSEVGANKNVEWVYCFYKMDRCDSDVQDAEWNQPIASYPGDEYVDWVGVDFYNYFPKYDEVWKDFKEQFAEQYLYMSENFPNKPIQISEFATNQEGGDKGQWFIDMNDDIKKLFPRLKLYNYFEINKEADWRIASSPESQKAFQEIMRDTFNRSSSAGLNNVINTYKTDVSLINDTDIPTIKDYLKMLESKKSKAVKKYLDKKQSAYFSTINNPIIDGKISDNEWGNPTGEVSNGSIFYVAFDDDNYYIAGKIIDKTPLQNSKDNGEVWNGDAIEVAIGFNHKAEEYRANFGDDDIHIAIKASEQAYVWSWKKNEQLSNAEVKMQKTKTGYNFEVKIPYKSVSKLKLTKGNWHDFEIAIDSGDKTERKEQFRWNSKEDGFYRHPYMWGKLITKEKNNEKRRSQ